MKLSGTVVVFFMKRYFFCIKIIAFLLLSCSETKQGDLLEIPVDIDQNSLMPLSEIAEEITAVELELTDESLISSDYIQNIIVSENEVFIARMDKIYIFNKEGKFIRTIGSSGQGPGEYTYIMDLALDEKNRRLFISSAPKIISYDLNGKLLKEIRILSGSIPDINYINEELLILVNKFSNDNNGIFLHPTLYRLNDDLRVVDSCTIMNLHLGDGYRNSIHSHSDFILKGSKSFFVYYGDFTWRLGNNLIEKNFSDTLYRFESNHPIPELKLKFKNEGVSKFIDLYNVYRSSRYIFAIYRNDNNRKSIYFFCYDTKIGKGYNMQGGFTDDIHQIEEPVVIRPFNLDTEMFYYLHTHMKPDDLEEPNPTLYIGKLKK